MKKYYTGAIKSPIDLRNYHIAKASKMVDLPTSFELPHTHIKDQGSVGSCVAHSVSEILEAYDGVNYSTGWIHGYRPEGYYQGRGMVTSDALKTIKNVGYLNNNDFPVNIEMDEAKKAVDSELNTLIPKANQMKIGSYARLYGLDEIKQALYENKLPVLISIGIGEGLKLDEDYVAYIPETISSGHAVVCYGWNEKGLLIQNSWGEEWGNNGTFILPYNYAIDEAWMISFNKEESSIEKPKLYWLRELIMKIIKILEKLKERYL